MKLSLTAKQENFAQAIVDGKGPSAAYRASYNWNGKKQVVAVRANELLHIPMVKERINALRARLDKSRHASREEKRGILAEILRNEKLRAAERTKAIEVDNVMTGDNAPQQVNVFGLGDLLAMVRRGGK